MVVIAAWADGQISTKNNIGGCARLAKKVCQQANISLQDVGLLIYSGVYRPNFRSEPSCASHIQSELNIRCHDLEVDSQHCFSFDVVDGSRGPHRAVQSVKQMLEQMGEKYALVICAEVKPTKQSHWPYQNHALAMLLAEEGKGMEFVNSEFSNGELQAYSKTSFDSVKKVSVIKYFADSEKTAQTSSETEFISDNSSLGSIQIRDFLLWSQDKKGKLKHTIIDRAGSKSVSNWSA